MDSGFADPYKIKVDRGATVCSQDPADWGNDFSTILTISLTIEMIKI